jgi:hypothetical protein
MEGKGERKRDEKYYFHYEVFCREDENMEQFFISMLKIQISRVVSAYGRHTS